MSRRDDGLKRFAKAVKDAFRTGDENFRRISLAIQELNERITELEEYVVDSEGRDRRPEG